jgi:hypothetical protein
MEAICSYERKVYRADHRPGKISSTENLAPPDPQYDGRRRPLPSVVRGPCVGIG